MSRLVDFHLGQRLAALFLRQRHQPVAAGPGAQLGGQIVEQHLRRVAGQADVDAAGLDAHQAHAALHQHLEGHVSLVRRQGRRCRPATSPALAALPRQARGAATKAMGIGSGSTSRIVCAPPPVVGMRVCATALALPPLPEPAGDPFDRGAAARAGCPAFQRFQRLVQRRQVGGMRQPDQHHFGGADRPVGRLHLGNALQQHLPGARQHPDRQRLGEVRAALPLVLATARHRRWPSARNAAG